MGSSDSNQIPAILALVGEARPQSILDIGIGWGRYGALFRLSFEHGYADVSNRSKWQVRIDGIEGFPDYVGAIQRAVYDDIRIGTIQEFEPALPNYDVILMGDVIEHIDKDEGLALIRRLLTKTNKRLIVATPNGPYPQDAALGNELQKHRSFWVPADFCVFPHREIYQNRKSVVAVLGNEPFESRGRKWRAGRFRRYPAAENIGARAAYYRRKWLG